MSRTLVASACIDGLPIVSSPRNNRQLDVAIVREAAGELADRLHRLCLRQQVLCHPARPVLRFQFARSLLAVSPMASVNAEAV